MKDRDLKRELWASAERISADRGIPYEEAWKPARDALLAELKKPFDKSAAQVTAGDLHTWSGDMRLGEAADALGCRDCQIRLAVQLGDLPLSNYGWDERWYLCRVSASALEAFMRDASRTLPDEYTAMNTLIRKPQRPEPPKPTAEQIAEGNRRAAISNARFLYLVEYTGYCVKVGITGRPETRIASHRAIGVAMGREVGRVWLSDLHLEAKDNERALKGDSRTEYLQRSYDDVMGQALALPMTVVELNHG